MSSHLISQHGASFCAVGGGTYTALGDSYSAGVGAGDLSDGDCQQAASAAWGTMLAQQLGVPPGQFTLAACSGYTSVDVLNKELGSLSAATTLITLTAGETCCTLQHACMHACCNLPHARSKEPMNRACEARANGKVSEFLDVVLLALFMAW